jgi:hypothetical protein
MRRNRHVHDVSWVWTTAYIRQRRNLLRRTEGMNFTDRARQSAFSLYRQVFHRTRNDRYRSRRHRAKLQHMWKRAAAPMLQMFRGGCRILIYITTICNIRVVP